MSCLRSLLPCSRYFQKKDLVTSAICDTQPAGTQPASPRPHLGSGARTTKQPWALAALLLSATAVFAQSAPSPTFPAPQAVGTSSNPVTVTVTARAAGTVATVEVLTLGAQNLDFQSGGGASTCPTASLAVLQTCTESVLFTPAYPGIRQGAVVLLDGSNNVLGTAYLSGTGSGGLAVFVPGNVIPAAGSGEWDLLEDGQLAVAADLNLPSSEVLDGAGNMYIADSVHNRIRKVDATTKIISTIAGNGDASYLGDGGPASKATLNSPSGIALDGAGNLYIADTSNNVIRKIDAATGIITTVAGNPSESEPGDDGPATSAGLNNPWGVTLDGAGNLFIADTNNHRIRRVDVITRMITTVAGTGFTNSNGSGGYSGDNGRATKAELNHPFAVAFDAAGNMYIPDASNNRVRVVNLSGIITTFAGTGVVGYSGDGAAATKADLWYPAGVIVDAAQNLYIADSQNNAIRKVNAATGFISTVVPSGKSLQNGSTLYTVGLYGPLGLALDSNGNLYIADYFNMRIRELQSNVGVLDFTAKSTRQGDTSAPQAQTLENDGNAALSLTTVTPISNSAVDAGATTCALAAVAVDTTCLVSAEFAPTVAGNPLVGDIDVTGQSVNSPLHIELVGNATTVNSTDIILTATPNPSNFAQNVAFKAAVTTGTNTGALTGTITFVDTTTGITLQKGIPLSASGVATFNTSALSVGAHAVTAAYSGDTGHFASTSSIVNQVVDEVTTVGITSSANPSTVGATVTLTATVAISGGGGVAPTGTVTFNDGATVLGTVTLGPTGAATWSTSTFTDGIHAITATYSGDAAYYILGATSAVLSQDVQATSTVALTSTPNPSSYGVAVTFTATVTGNGSIAPTGTVNFLDGATQIGSAAITGTSGVATFTTSALTSGTHAITAAYLGCPNDGPATSAPIVQTVNKTATATTLLAAPNPGIAGQAVTLTATVKTAAGAATTNGTITFTDGATSLGTAALGANGTASVSPILAPGPHAIVAGYGGDANDDVSSSAALALPVNLATTAVKLSSSASPASVLASITFTAAVTGNGGVPTGALTFSIDGATVNTATLDAAGKASFSDSGLAVGSHMVTASYGGDQFDSAGISNTLTQVVGAIPTVSTLGTGTTAGPTPQTVLIATAIGSSGPTPTGTFTFTNGSKVIGTATLDTNGVGTLIPDLAPATYNIVANYSGDALHGPSSSSAVTVSGTPTGFAITVNPSTITLSTSSNVMVTVNINSNNSFADKVGLGCGTLPAGVTCHFNNNDVDLKAGSSDSVQLVIDTNSPLGGGVTAMNSPRGPAGFSLAGLFLPAGLLFGWIGWRFRKRNAIVFGVMLILCLSGALMVTGCGAFTQKSAAPGTYIIQVTGVGTSSNITHYQNITLTITK
jgi:large repetitive protein